MFNSAFSLNYSTLERDLGLRNSFNHVFCSEKDIAKKYVYSHVLTAVSSRENGEKKMTPLRNARNAHMTWGDDTGADYLIQPLTTRQVTVID